jgi:hypothetical protein
MGELVMSREDERQLSTADFAAAGERRPEQSVQVETRDEAAMRERGRMQQPEGGLAPLFLGDVADEFRQRWDTIQIGFVDDPRQAVQGADELVAQVMKSLAGSFAEQRERIEADIGSGGQADTENLRVALQRYRSFFQRLLSI